MRSGNCEKSEIHENCTFVRRVISDYLNDKSMLAQSKLVRSIALAELYLGRYLRLYQCEVVIVRKVRYMKIALL